MVKFLIVFLAVVSFMVMVTMTGEVYAGGEEDTIEPVKEKIVVTTEDSQNKLVWFVVGFLAAVFLTAI